MAPTIDRARQPGDAASDLTLAQLEVLRRHLAEERAEHRARVAQDDALLETLTADSTGEPSVQETEMARVLAVRARDDLEEIESALGRMADGTYGVCEWCRRPIPFARLEALPAVRSCVACPPSTLVL